MAMTDDPYWPMSWDELPDPNKSGTRKARKAAKRIEIKIANGRPLAVCRVCHVVFADRANTYEEPYWWMECEEHRPIA